MTADQHRERAVLQDHEKQNEVEESKFFKQ